MNRQDFSGLWGEINLADSKIEFVADEENHTVMFKVWEYSPNGLREETRVVSQDKFFKALAIAVHNDGMPDAEKDYPDAESIMGEIRWIP